MSLLFDTGSSWLWVPSDDCPANQCPGNRFKNGESITFQKTGATEKITYGKGEVDGNIVTDQIHLSTSTGTINDFVFLSIYQAADLTGLEADGLLGLSPT